MKTHVLDRLETGEITDALAPFTVHAAIKLVGPEVTEVLTERALDMSDAEPLVMFGNLVLTYLEGQDAVEATVLTKEQP